MLPPVHMWAIQGALRPLGVNYNHLEFPRNEQRPSKTHQESLAGNHSKPTKNY